MIDATFTVGSLTRPEVEAEPDEPAEDVTAILDEADAIVTAAGPEILAEVEEQRRTERWWWPWGKRRGRGDDDGGIHLSSR